MVDSILRNKLQWNPEQNSYIFIQENAYENVVCQMAAILSRPQCVNNNSNDGVRWMLQRVVLIYQ